VNERPVVATAPPSPELLSELSRLELENAQLRSMLEHLTVDEMEAPEHAAPRWRWWAGRTIAALLFAAGVAVATLMLVESPSGRPVRGAFRAVWRQGVRDGFRDAQRDRMRNGGILMPAPVILPMPPIPRYRQ
jgi:hypothetical protein